MLKVNIDILNDYQEIILLEIEKLKKIGFKFIEYEEWNKSIDNKNENSLVEYKKKLISSYANLNKKLPIQKPRKIKYSSKFECEKSLINGLKIIENKIINGDLIWPHFSTTIFNPDKKDAMLYEFNVYHLHLGTKQYEKNSFFINRSGKILYCMFDIDYSYFLIIDDHNKWESFDILRIVKNDFPHLLLPWKTKIQVDPIKSITEEDRRKLRKNGVNSLIDLDGDCYGIPGGGFDLQGNSVFTQWQMDKTLYIYNQYNAQLKHIINEKRNEIEKNFNIINNELNLKLLDIEKLTLIDYRNKIIIYPTFDVRKNIKSINITLDV